MQTSSKKSQSSFSKSTDNQTIQKISIKDKSIYFPSFSGITSNQTFQQSAQSNRISQKSSTDLRKVNQNLDDINLINDGLEYIFDFTNAEIDNDDIFDIFQELSKQLLFQMIQRQQQYATAIKENNKGSLMSKVNIIQWFAGCFPSFNKKNQVNIAGEFMSSNAPTAIKIIISKISDDDKIRKICRIRVISGLIKQGRTFIQKYKQKVSHYLPETVQSYSNYFFYDTQKQIQQQTKKSIQHSDPYHLQISTFYYIQKTLSNQKFQIGKMTNQLIDDFKNTFKNIQQSVSLIPQPVNNCIKIVNQILYWVNGKDEQKNTVVKGIKAKKNSTNDNYKKQVHLLPSMLPFLRISVEKYVFKKLSHPIMDIYKLKNVQNQTIFKNKRIKIFQKYSTRQILQQISLNEKYWGVSKNQIEILDHIHSQQQTRKILKMAPICCSQVPICFYKTQIQKIQITQNPRQKIKHLQLAYTGLKTFFYDFSKQKYELSSMQDIIPILILIMLLVNIENLRQQLDLIGDFIDSDPYEMQSEKRLFINVSESYNYVLRDWKI